MTQWLANEELSISILNSGLYLQLASKTEYVSTIRKMRDVAAALSQRTGDVLPGFTDHSVAHMDELWKITDQVLRNEEIATFSSAEAFLLASSFYVHDLGMALPVTRDGEDQIKNSEAYRVARARFAKFSLASAEKVDELALREATRELHAKKALDLATKAIPGLHRFMIEDTDFRSRWGNLIGTISESHHWSLSEVEQSLGSAGITPGPDGEPLDMAYVACALRVIDFAHINRGRAPQLERWLRRDLPRDSALHWDAQAKITGPVRDSDVLVFACTEPVTNIDAWWLFYDLAVGLDAEIKSVHEYLRNRTVSASRFSLQGVKGVEDPVVFNRYVRLPKEVLPIDIRVQPDSMERIVELLGGRQIYGDDRLAPIRELIQNARDALELRKSLDHANGHPSPPGTIVVSVDRGKDKCVLKVSDNGVGMTRTVVRRHLVSVGSDFWNSAEFYRRFTKAVDVGFRPIGRFGIGFLSVFMLGDHVEVETEAVGGGRIRLTLEGVGRRGELVEMPTVGQPGTEIRIILKTCIQELTDNLPAIVRARAPMLAVPITVSVTNGDAYSSATIEPGWWKTATNEELFEFIKSWTRLSKQGSTQPPSQTRRRYFQDEDYLQYYHHVDFGNEWTVKGWPSEKPAYLKDSERLVSSGGDACFGVIRCSQGIAVDHFPVGDLSGLVEVGIVDMNVAREYIAGSDVKRPAVAKSQDKLGSKLISDIRPAVIEKVNQLRTHGMLPGRINFLRGLVTVYGAELFDKTDLPWIPVTEPSGDLIHKSKDQVIDEVRKLPRILIACGASPARMYVTARSTIPVAQFREMLVIATLREEVKVDYESKDRLQHGGSPNPLIGELEHVLSEAGCKDAQLILTNFFIKCVAEAWCTSSQELESQDWRLDYKDSVLWAELKKP